MCCRRRKEIVKRDYNDIYGTYARGWDGEGDYGDGDRIEMTDQNPVYGTYVVVDSTYHMLMADHNPDYGT